MFLEGNLAVPISKMYIPFGPINLEMSWKCIKQVSKDIQEDFLWHYEKTNKIYIIEDCLKYKIYYKKLWYRTSLGNANFLKETLRGEIAPALLQSLLEY